jgi:DNA-binding response OmpR family regulator
MPKERILIVEDDSELAKVLRLYLQRHNYEVEVAQRGTEALDICRKNSLNLVLLDIKLPDIDGYEVLTRLRRRGQTAALPVILLTQNDQQFETMRQHDDRYGVPDTEPDQPLGRS